MSRPRTSVIGEQDDEETTVDRHSWDLASASCKTEVVDPADLLPAASSFGRTESVPQHEDVDREVTRHAQPAGPVDRRLSIFGRFQARSLGVGGVLLGFVCALTMFAYREHQNARALRKAIEEIARAPNGAGLADEQAFTRSSNPARVDQARRSRTHRDVDRVSLERRGADLLAANDYLGALTHYRALAQEFPDEPVFAEVVMVLELKQRCVGSTRAIGETCQ
jgi:hypothetical protein